jgi:DNA-directed RNA polymerase subunit RPC12/RpoP
MARESYRIVVCGNCGQQLEDVQPLGSGFTGESRPPCPNCGSEAREYRLGLAASIAPSGDVTIRAPAATAYATAMAPTLSIEENVAAGTFIRTVVWSKTPDAWLAEVRDQGGSLVAVEISFDVMDTLVLLAEHLLPPGE